MCLIRKLRLQRCVALPHGKHHVGYSAADIGSTEP